MAESHREVDLRSLNLNLVPVLQALLKEGGVVRAADSIQLSQPAVSSALVRLRSLLGDPLLVREGRSTRLTPRARQLAEDVDDVCARLERLFAPAVFDPARAHRHFVIAAPDYIVHLLSGPLISLLRQDAPGISVSFVDVQQDLVDRLEHWSLDMAVCANFKIWPELRYQRVFLDRIVAAVSRDHELASRQTVTSEELLPYPTVTYSRDIAVVTGLPSMDYEAQVAMRQFLTSVLLAGSSSIVARVPASLVDGVRHVLPVVPIELAPEANELDTGIFWSARNDQDRPHEWMREVIRDALRSTVGETIPAAS